MRKKFLRISQKLAKIGHFGAFQPGLPRPVGWREKKFVKKLGKHVNNHPESIKSIFIKKFSFPYLIWPLRRFLVSPFRRLKILTRKMSTGRKSADWHRGRPTALQAAGRSSKTLWKRTFHFFGSFEAMWTILGVIIKERSHYKCGRRRSFQW